MERHQPLLPPPRRAGTTEPYFYLTGQVRSPSLSLSRSRSLARSLALSLSIALALSLSRSRSLDLLLSALARRNLSQKPPLHIPQLLRQPAMKDILSITPA